MSSLDIFVRPMRWEQAPTSERFSLSPIAHTMPKIYVLMVEVFPFPAGQALAPESIIDNMTAGLEFTLSQFPAMASTLKMDETSGRMWAEKTRSSGVHFHVKYMTTKLFPSYHDLEKKDFPASMLDGNKLLPASVTAKQLHSPDGNNDTDGIPLAVLQLNFIEGGLILSIAVHHVLSDGPGCDGFLTTWAESTTAIARGQPCKALDLTFDKYAPPFHVETPSESRFSEIKNAYPMLKDVGGPMAAPPPGFQMPTLVPQMWHFPKSKLDQLKTQATASDGNGSWISTYDAVIGLLWSRITAAKVPMLQPDSAATTTLVHAVNTRNIWANPSLPERFLGTAAVQGRAGPLSIQDICSTPENLPAIASTITGHKDQRYLETNVNSFLGMDLGASSWQGIKAYEKHDFGFGLPRALRWPSPPFEGFVFLYPSRACFKDEEADEGIEVCVCLEESCNMRLLVDTVLGEYAQPRG